MWFDSKLINNRFRIENTSKVNNNRSERVSFRQGLVQDTFQNNSPSRLFNEVAIRKMIASNSEVTKILDEYKLPIYLNIKELQDLKNGHCPITQDVSMAIFRHLPKVLTKDVNVANLKDGAFLHDFGKVLIPPAILNKNSSLTVNEHGIMDLHTELGYQLLKTTNVNEEVLNLVRNHHKTFEKTDSGITYVPDVSLQILNLADKYSALTEKRTYKEAFSQSKALSILAQETQEGKIPPIIFKALLDAVDNGELK